MRKVSIWLAINIGYVITKFGDRPIDTYSSSEAANMRDHLLGRGLKVTSVSRIFATIRAVVNLTIGEEGLDLRNPFANTFLPKDPNHEKRKAIPLDVIKKLQAECLRVRDPNRLLIALISDTGMRLSEAVGLVWDDVVLDHQHPHINLKPPLEIITGSKIIFLTLIKFKALITILITLDECNIPILIASGLISLQVKTI